MARFLLGLVLFFPKQTLTPAALLAFAESFGELDTPHHVYPHVPGYERIVLLENDGDRRPNTDVWHTDLTFKHNPPFDVGQPGHPALCRRRLPAPVSLYASRHGGQ